MQRFQRRLEIPFGLVCLPSYFPTALGPPAVTQQLPILALCVELRQSTSPSFMTEGSSLDKEMYCRA